MFNFGILPSIKFNGSVTFNRALCALMVMVATVCLLSCGNKDKKRGQVLARVNGKEITVRQINDELTRAAVKSDQQAAATAHFLELLIDRQLVTEAAIRKKLDRTPKVMQAIEREKSEIIAQAYLESVVTRISKPSIMEVNDYFQQHPEYFSERKQFDMYQLIFSTSDLSDELKLFIDSAKSIDEVAGWMDMHNVKYARGQLSRSTTDMPEQMVSKIKAMNAGQLFLIREGENTLLNSIFDIKDSPVSLKNAALQIERYLIKNKSKDAANTEIAYLRSLAKIEYLNASAPVAHPDNAIQAK
ncbi:MAG TPA: EpsD family peptidyl-prolyl cis-trans isomerase [Gallionellaceae bacterium]|nr:EpsD family peptidyl-prolyl cis-trans isomerase [Gallionellaceae bacterium]